MYAVVVGEKLDEQRDIIGGGSRDAEAVERRRRERSIRRERRTW